MNADRASRPEPVAPAQPGGPVALARRTLERFAALVLLALIVLTAVDVAGRYLFGAPVPGGFEWVRALMGVLVFAGLPLVSARNEHLRAGILDHLVSPRVNRLREPLVQAASAIVLAVIAWRLAIEARTKWTGRETLMGLDVPLGALVAFMAAMTALAAIAAAVLAAGALRAGAR